MSAPPIPPRMISHGTHEWRVLFALLEYHEELPSQDARAVWLDRLQRLRPALFDSLRQLQDLRERADACGFMCAPVSAGAELRMRVDSLTRESHHHV